MWHASLCTWKSPISIPEPPCRLRRMVAFMTHLPMRAPDICCSACSSFSAMSAICTVHNVVHTCFDQVDRTLVHASMRSVRSVCQLRCACRRSLAASQSQSKVHVLFPTHFIFAPLPCAKPQSWGCTCKALAPTRTSGKRQTCAHIRPVLYPMQAPVVGLYMQGPGIHMPTWPAANSLLETRGEAERVATQYLFHSRSSMCASVEDLKKEMSRE